MTPRERVLAALAHTQPDCTPCDYWGTPEIKEGLRKHFGVKTEDDIHDRLGTDLRHVLAPYSGPELPTYDDGAFTDIWGVIRTPMANEYGEYAEPSNLPFAAWTSVEQAEGYNWPRADCYDYDAVPALCEQYGDYAIYTGGGGFGDYINGVAFGRGVEQVLLDIALKDPVYLYIVQKRHAFFMEHTERTLRAAAGRIDLVLCGDDFGSQRGPLISPATFAEIFAPLKKEYFDMVHSYGAKITHHSCGSTVELIPQFIEIGMDSHNAIQPQAVGMNPYDLKAQFGGRLTFHGAVDVQGWLQRVSVAEVKEEVHRLMDDVGKGGGYILAPCHNIQPDTPIENALAIYDAVAEGRS